MLDQQALNKGWPVAGNDQLLPVDDSLFGVQGSNVLDLSQQAIAIDSPVGIFPDQELRPDVCWNFNMDAG